MHRVVYCVRETHTTEAVHWTEAQRVCVCLESLMAALRGVATLLSTFQLGKQSMGVVRCLAVGVFYHRAEVNLPGQQRNSFLPDLAFSGFHLRTCASAKWNCKDSQLTACRSRAKYRHEATNKQSLSGATTICHKTRHTVRKKSLT